uniref:Uncharacterized protein n=1 Tax=uncultured marine group II/III euryarchaeote KM3_47_D05 TaxID=1456451 RepID=A0A075H3X1_9EURY|nr:hypothetical protein [uncultured marine group II/III euryarchaeote KM3_47_D05]
MGETSPVKPITNHASSMSEGRSTTLTDQLLSPSGVERLASKTCLVPSTCSPETTTQPPSALVAVSVGLARPCCALASAEWPMRASSTGSMGSSGLV